MMATVAPDEPTPVPTDPSVEQPPVPTDTPNLPTQEPTDIAATSKLKASKSSVVIAAGKTKTVKFTATKDVSASKAAGVTASASDKKVISKVVVSDNGEVKITIAKKAVKGASATVTLKSQNAAGKTVSTKIKVTVQNKVKKAVAAKKSLTVKKGGTSKLVLNVTAENNKKATTDSVKVSSGYVGLVKKITIKVGSKKVKVTVKVK